MGLSKAPQFFRHHWWVIPVTVLTVLHCYCYIRGVNIFPYGYFWALEEQPIGPLWLIGVLAAATAGVGWFVLRSGELAGPRILALVLLGYLLQMGFAWSEGRGLNGIRYQMVESGHAEFARVAVHVRSNSELLGDYQELVEAGRLNEYTKSKPPGTMWLYVGTDHLARLIYPSDAESCPANPRSCLVHMQILASLLWPLICYLVLPPLYYLTRHFSDASTGLLACLLYVVVPSVTLVTLHTDQAFFPVAITATLALWVMAIERRSGLLAALAGCCAYFCVFLSYGLAVVFPLGVVLAVAAAMRLGQQRRQHKYRHWLGLSLAVVAGLLAVDLLMKHVAGYDLYGGFGFAYEHHIAWKGWNPEWPGALAYVKVDTMEFLAWLGVPITCALLMRLGMSAWHGAKKTPQPLDIVSVGVLLAILGLGYFGKTLSEVARLWIFLVPLCCLSAADALRVAKDAKGVTDARSLSRAVLWMVLLQWGTIYCTKRWQDF